MRVITVKLPEELLQKLDLFCKMNGMSRSVAIRLAINKLLREGFKVEPVN